MAADNSQVRTLPELLELCEGITDISTLQGKLPARVSYRGEYIDGELHRILFWASKDAADLRTPLMRECHGLVVDSHSGKILARPVRTIFRKASIDDFIANFQQYDVYEVVDGTIVTLYWWAGRWQFATGRAWDVSSYKWLQNITYHDAIMEVAKKSGLPDDWLDKLDKNCSYSIGFRHHHFHPLLRDKARIWLARCSNTETGEDQECDIFPKQVLAELPISAGETFTSKNITKMIERNMDALSDFLQEYRRDPTAEASPHYGYVMRSKTADHPDMILESTVLQFIRKTMYNISNEEIKKDAYTFAERMKYVLLQAFLFPQDSRAIFQEIYPQFSADFVDLENKFLAVEKQVKAQLLSRSKRFTPRSGVDKIAAVVIGQLCQDGVNVGGPNSCLIIKDFIRDHRRIDVYYDCLYKKALRR